jgi:hypothetical protein
MVKLLFVIVAILLQVLIVNGQTNQKEFPILKGPYLGQNPPRKNPEIFAKGFVSTDMYNHCSISISPDGKEIYWAMSPLDTPGRIYFSKMIAGVWNKPEVVSFTRTEDGDCPVISPDSKIIYFNSNRPLPNGNKRREMIWCVERTSLGWGNPFPLGVEINEEHLHWQTSIDARGNLFFGSERSVTKGKDDVFMSKSRDGVFQKPVSLGPEINTTEHEGCPFVAPNGSYLIFSRDGLWISFKEKDGGWTKAISMGNIFKGAICPYVSPDGKYIFFLTMGMDYNDIYWTSAKIIEELRPKE